MTLKDKNLYYVGGVVRDEMLGVKSIDIDYCYVGNAIDFSKNLNVVKTNPDFGTVRIKDKNGNEIDIASTRKEKYPRKGHLPKITKIGCSLKDDLIRRDFSINAMAKRTTDGEIIDYFKGKEDIEKKVLRILHKNSFIDDPTRIIRGLKFSVRFGFELEEETKKLQEEYLKNINYDMSYHRVKKELVETFNLNKGEAFDKFVEQKIYKLLGKNQKPPKIKGEFIEKVIKEKNVKNPWLIYMSFFDLSKLELTRAEKMTLLYAEKLETKPPTNNTPKNSIVIYELRKSINKPKQNNLITDSETIQNISAEQNKQNIGLGSNNIKKHKDIHLRFAFNPYLRYKSENLKNYVGVNQYKREHQIIVSITSYEERFKDLELSLYSLLNQSLQPDRIILWLSNEYELSTIPYDITKYIKNGLEIRFVKDIGAYTKIIYALKEFSDSIIVTADDDIIYPKDWLKKLYLSYVAHPEDIHVHRAHRVSLNNREFLPYETWVKHVREESARYDNFLTGVGGVLYPPKCFNREVFREDIFIESAPYADDIWLWVMALVSGRKIRVVKGHIKTLTCTNIFRQIGIVKERTLYSENKNGGNDTQLRNLMKYYKQNVLNKLNS